MTLYVVYRQKEYTKHYAYFFSRASLFVFIFTITPLYVSLISAYRTYGFYSTSTYIQSQPVVNLQPDMVLSFLTGQSATYTWSTLQKTPPNCLPTISINEIDANDDGIKESLSMTVKLYKPGIKGIKFLLQFDYNITTDVSVVKLQQPVVVFVDVLRSVKNLVVMGRLDVAQTRRLPSSGIYTGYNDTYYNASSSSSILGNPFDNVAARDSSRNFTVRLKDIFTAWEIEPTSNVFEVNLEIMYGLVELQYHTEFWAMVKWGWVQWFYFLVFFVFSFYRFTEFVFESFAVSAKKRTTQMHQCDAVTKPNYTTAL